MKQVNQNDQKSTLKWVKSDVFYLFIYFFQQGVALCTNSSKVRKVGKQAGSFWGDGVYTIHTESLNTLTLQNSTSIMIMVISPFK